MPSPIVARIFDRNLDERGVADEIVEWGGQDVAGDDGSGTFTIKRNDPYLASNVIRIDDVVRLETNDGTVLWSFVVETITYRQIEEGLDRAEGWVVAGPGTMTLFHRILVAPPLGPGRALYSDTRVWNFAAPEYDDTALPSAVVTEKALVGVNFGIPDLYPDPDAYWIWNVALPGGIGVPGTTLAPAGTCYFMTTFEMPAASFVEIWGAADDNFELWIDGVYVAGQEGWYKGETVAKKLRLDGGEHRIAARVTNVNEAKAGFLASVIEVDPGGTYGDVVARTDGTWKCLAYPAEPPGFTLGKILRILLDEGVNGRDGNPNLAVDFTDTHDSAGNPWAILSEFAASIGATLYSVIRQAGEAFVDVKMSASGLTLSAWNAGTFGADFSATVSFDNDTNDPEVSNVLSMTHIMGNVGEIGTAPP